MKNPNVCRKIMYVLIVTGLIIANGSALLYGTDPLPVGSAVGAMIAFAGIIFGFLTVRCPHCGKLLNLKGWDTDYCPACGHHCISSSL